MLAETLQSQEATLALLGISVLALTVLFAPGAQEPWITQKSIALGALQEMEMDMS